MDEALPAPHGSACSRCACRMGQPTANRGTASSCLMWTCSGWCDYTFSRILLQESKLQCDPPESPVRVVPKAGDAASVGHQVEHLARADGLGLAKQRRTHLLQRLSVANTEASSDSYRAPCTQSPAVGCEGCCMQQRSVRPNGALLAAMYTAKWEAWVTHYLGGHGALPGAVVLALICMHAHAGQHVCSLLATSCACSSRRAGPIAMTLVTSDRW